MKKDKIMVFIPVYNCEKQITRVLSQINDDVLTYVDEIIVVNNLSTDNTVKVTRDYLLKHRELPCKIIMQILILADHTKLLLIML